MNVVWDGEENTCKLVLLGESGVGKSSLALRFVSNEFKHYTESTIGANYVSKTIAIDPNRISTFSDISDAGSSSDAIQERKVTFKIWDTAGQERFHSLVPMYYRGAGAAILVFDICRPESLVSLRRWVDDLKANGPPDIVLAVCGNKADLERDRRVSRTDANRFAAEIGAFYIESSARDDTNVEHLFHEVAVQVAQYDMSSSTVCTGLVDSFESLSLNIDGGFHKNFCC